MNTLAAHIDHRVAPGSDSTVARSVGEILSRPCFELLARVAINIKERDKSHQPKTAAAVAASLLASGSEAAVLDNGRQGELIASARVWTGRHIETYDEPKPLLASYVVIPYNPEARTEMIDALVDLATALHAIAGYVTIERGYSDAHKAVLSSPPPAEQIRDFPRRAKERKAHYWYDKRVNAEISGPDWGIVLGPDHLKRFAPDPTVFPIIREAGASKFVFLSPDPADALTAAFDKRLDAARNALAPLLMDVSKVPIS